MVRLYCENSLSSGDELVLSITQSHYILNVMRLKIGAEFKIFNEKDGEYIAEIMYMDKKKLCYIVVKSLINPPRLSKSLSIVFAPIKHPPATFLVQKATELGVTDIYPILTQRTVVRDIGQDKLRLAAIEASEQCGRFDIPTIYPIQTLSKFVNCIQRSHLIFCDEKENSTISIKDIKDISRDCVLLIGPEGGFSEEERIMLIHLPQTKRISLGNNILRAETALIAGLAMLKLILE